MADLFDVSVGGVGWHFTSHLVALAALFIACFAIAGYITFRKDSIPGDALKDHDVDVDDITGATLALSGNATVGSISTGSGQISSTVAKTLIPAGALPATLLANTHYLVTGTITAGTAKLPTGVKGDVIYIEYAAAQVTNIDTNFSTPVPNTDFFSSDSRIYVAAVATTNTPLFTVDAADGTADDHVNVAADSDDGPGIGSWFRFTRLATQWRCEGVMLTAGAGTAPPAVAFATAAI